MSIKRKTSKYYIHKEIELLIIKLIKIKNLFFIYKKLSFKNEYEYIYKTIPKTSSILLQAIMDKIILELTCLVVDKSDDDLSILGFINKYHEYKSDYKEKKYIYIKYNNSNKKKRLYIETRNIEDDINKLERYIKDNETICRYLKKYRDKTISHNDKKINFKPKYKYKEMKKTITFDQIEKFIDNLYTLMNKIYSTLFKTKFAYLDELNDELSYLNKILEIEYNKRKEAIKNLNND